MKCCFCGPVRNCGPYLDKIYKYSNKTYIIKNKQFIIYSKQKPL